MIKAIDHIGIAVKSINEQLTYYENVLGLKAQKIETVELEGVKVCLFDIDGVHIELLEPISESSAIKKFLDNKGEGIHHISYRVEDINKAMNNAKQNNIQLINDAPKDGADNKKICFIHPKSSYGVLTEFCQKIGADNE